MTDTLLLTTELPASPEAFRDASWADVLPYYDALATAPLEATSASVEPWLGTWSRLDTLVGEAGTLAMIDRKSVV